MYFGGYFQAQPSTPMTLSHPLSTRCIRHTLPSWPLANSNKWLDLTELASRIQSPKKKQFIAQEAANFSSNKSTALVNCNDKNAVNFRTISIEPYRVPKIHCLTSSIRRFTSKRQQTIPPRNFPFVTILPSCHFANSIKKAKTKRENKKR